MNLPFIMKGGQVVFATGCNPWADTDPEDVRAALKAQVKVALESADDCRTRAYLVALPPTDISAVSPQDGAAQRATAEALQRRAEELRKIAGTLAALAVLLCGPEPETSINKE